MELKSKNGLPFYTRTLLVNNRPIKFIVDTGSPLTPIPKTEFNKITTIRPVVEDTGKIKFEGKTTANVEIDCKTRQLELLITTRQTHPLLGLNWMENLGITLRTEAPHQTINQIDQPNQTINNPDADITTLKSKFYTLFAKILTIKNMQVDTQLKEGAKLLQQKGRPIPIHRKSKKHRREVACKSRGNYNQKCQICKNIPRFKKVG